MNLLRWWQVMVKTKIPGTNLPDDRIYFIMDYKTKEVYARGLITSDIISKFVLEHQKANIFEDDVNDDNTEYYAKIVF